MQIDVSEILFNTGIAGVESQAELFALLTDRERELLLLVAEGHSNKAIAEEMIVSENTVKYHMKNLLQKLQLRNRTEAAAYAVRIGLLKNKVQFPKIEEN